MKYSLLISAFFCLGILAFSGCSNPSSQSDKLGNLPSGFSNPDDEDDDGVQAINGKFVEFELGDAVHIRFEDEDGQSWDFADNEAEDISFAMELPEEYADEDNQGWTSNPEHLGQWFSVEYTEEERAVTPDGPEETVMVITDVVPLTE